MTSTSTTIRAALTAIAAFAAFTLADTGIKLLSATMPVPQVTLIVMTLSLVIVVLYCLATGRKGDIVPKYPVLALGRAVLLAVDTLLFFFAVTRLPLTDVYVVAFTNPIIVSVLAFVFLRERLAPLTIFAILLGFAGVLVALQPGVAKLDIGHLAAFSAIVLFAFSLLLLRISKPDESDTALVTTVFAVLALIALGLALFVSGFVPVSVGSIGYIALSVAGTVLGHLLMVRAFRMANAGIVSPFAYTQLIWGTLLGWFVFGDVMQIHTLIGAIIIIVSGIIILRKG